MSECKHSPTVRVWQATNGECPMCLRDELDRLARENEALRRDAERWRWLRTKHESGANDWWVYGQSHVSDLDAAIDRAIQEGKSDE